MLLTGNDAALKGAVVTGDNVLVDVGGDLTVQSVADTGAGKGSSWSAGVSLGASISGTDPGVALGEGGKAALGLSGSSGSSSDGHSWIAEQSGIVGRGDVDVTVQGHTQLDAGVIASTGGDVSLDTGSLGWSDAAGYDRSRSTTIGAGGSIGLGGGAGSGSGSGGSGGSGGGSGGGASLPPPGLPLDTASLDYSATDREQVTRATVAAPNGSATITVRDTPAQDLSQLNQDLAKAQELTKDTRSSVRVYVSAPAIAEILDGFPTIQAGIEAIAEKLKAVMPDLSPKAADDLARQIKGREQVKEILKNSGLSDEVIEKELALNPGLKDLANAIGAADGFDLDALPPEQRAEASAWLMAGYTPVPDGNGGYKYVPDPDTYVEITDLPPPGGQAEPAQIQTPWKQAAQKAENIVLALNSLNEQYGTAIELATFGAYVAILGPFAGAAKYGLDTLIADASEPVIAAVVQATGAQIRNLDPTMTESEAEALAMPLIAIAGIAGGAAAGKAIGKILATKIAARLDADIAAGTASTGQWSKFFNQAAQAATHNANASEVVLGRYIAGSPESYEAVAQARGSTYFSMDNWGEVSQKIGSEKMWGINKAFLQQQIEQGKSFVFTSDPAVAAPKSYTQREYEFLMGNGYEIVPDVGGLYRAIKN